MSDRSPRVGELARDVRRGHVGVYMGMAGPHLMLRPLNGGREWPVAEGDVRFLAPEEARRAGVAR
ncbi:hypothetical protein [Streptomyces sp. NBC_01803]|uniref:hypothetical protein n=1 Tax=Streptomyces sp. NBC_01803 TaxID=2975946 RepID=UPI002DDBCC10|nr:hypothetical protein [Streptomyces sp. NBC_01803]WSA43492.1 hypothetical protein OIE51_04335 [Streptomyces sp. NBC_01803]